MYVRPKCFIACGNLISNRLGRLQPPGKYSTVAMFPFRADYSHASGTLDLNARP